MSSQPDVQAQFATELGFFAHWTNKRSEYHAGHHEEIDTSARIKAAFRFAQAQGCRMFGLYGARWSTGLQYFTFWRTPSLEIHDSVIGQLEAAGDFKFADSDHYIGVQAAIQPESVNWDSIRSGSPDNRMRIATIVFCQPRQTVYRNASSGPVSSEALAKLAECVRGVGGECLGTYYSRWSCSWAHFAFFRLPEWCHLEDAAARFEDSPEFTLCNWRFVAGQLEHSFRFAERLQPDPEREKGGY